jgi:predicted DNA-binding protein with PD1-like motif
MKTKCLHDRAGQRTFAVILETGEEVMNCLEQFAAAEKIFAAQITAIGAFSDVVLQYFDWNQKEYIRLPVPDQVEVASMLGDVAESPEGKPSIHVHLVIGKRDGTALAGHLGEAHVRPTLEVIVTESPSHLRKVKDLETGLALIRPDARPG